MAAQSDPNVFRCDVLDLDALGDVFDRTKPDMVVHFAAQAFNSWRRAPMSRCFRRISKRSPKPSTA